MTHFSEMLVITYEITWHHNLCPSKSSLNMDLSTTSFSRTLLWSHYICLILLFQAMVGCVQSDQSAPWIRERTVASGWWSLRITVTGSMYRGSSGKLQCEVSRQGSVSLSTCTSGTLNLLSHKTIFLASVLIKLFHVLCLYFLMGLTLVDKLYYTEVNPLSWRLGTGLIFLHHKIKLYITKFMRSSRVKKFMLCRVVK